MCYLYGDKRSAYTAEVSVSTPTYTPPAGGQTGTPQFSGTGISDSPVVAGGGWPGFPGAGGANPGSGGSSGSDPVNIDSEDPPSPLVPVTGVTIQVAPDLDELSNPSHVLTQVVVTWEVPPQPGRAFRRAELQRADGRNGQWHTFHTTSKVNGSVNQSAPFSCLNYQFRVVPIFGDGTHGSSEIASYFVPLIKQTITEVSSSTIGIIGAPSLDGSKGDYKHWSYEQFGPGIGTGGSIQEFDLDLSTRSVHFYEYRDYITSLTETDIDESFRINGTYRGTYVSGSYDGEEDFHWGPDGSILGYTHDPDFLAPVYQTMWELWGPRVSDEENVWTVTDKITIAEKLDLASRSLVPFPEEAGGEFPFAVYSDDPFGTRSGMTYYDSGSILVSHVTADADGEAVSMSKSRTTILFYPPAANPDIPAQFTITGNWVPSIGAGEDVDGTLPMVFTSTIQVPPQSSTPHVLLCDVYAKVIPAELPAAVFRGQLFATIEAVKPTILKEWFPASGFDEHSLKPSLMVPQSLTNSFTVECPEAYPFRPFTLNVSTPNSDVTIDPERIETQSELVTASGSNLGITQVDAEIDGRLRERFDVTVKPYRTKAIVLHPLTVEYKKRVPLSKNQGKPDVLCVRPVNPATGLFTPCHPNDVQIGQQIFTGPDGVCDTLVTSSLDVQETKVGWGIPKNIPPRTAISASALEEYLNRVYFTQTYTYCTVVEEPKTLETDVDSRPFGVDVSPYSGLLSPDEKMLTPPNDQRFHIYYNSSFRVWDFNEEGKLVDRAPGLNGVAKKGVPGAAPFIYYLENPRTVAPLNTLAHEVGHLFGLDDIYSDFSIKQLMYGTGVPERTMLLRRPEWDKVNPTPP